MEDKAPEYDTPPATPNAAADTPMRPNASYYARNPAIALWIERGLALVLGAIFIAASAPKLTAIAELSSVISRYQILPQSLINPVAIVLPPIELVAALTVIFVGRFRSAAAFVMCVLLLAFTGATASVVLRGIDTICGCFSLHDGSAAVTWWHVVRGAVLAALAGWLSWLSWIAQPAVRREA